MFRETLRCVSDSAALRSVVLTHMMSVVNLEFPRGIFVSVAMPNWMVYWVRLLTKMFIKLIESVLMYQCVLLCQCSFAENVK